MICIDTKKKLLKEISHQAMFDVGDNELIDLVKEYDSFMKCVAILESIETSDITPLIYPYEIETNFLREDCIVHETHHRDILKNAKMTQDCYIKVPKVVK